MVTRFRNQTSTGLADPRSIQEASKKQTHGISRNFTKFSGGDCQALFSDINYLGFLDFLLGASKRHFESGVTVWSVVEPITIDFAATIPVEKRARRKRSNRQELQEISSVPRAEVTEEIKRLLEIEKLSLASIAQQLGLSLPTVRRVCRTLKIGPYGFQPRGSIASRSSQAPFGWDLVHGHLKLNPVEMRWVRKIHALRAGGLSLHGIAAFLTEEKVPTKNGGRWFAKTISQLLDFNRSYLNKSKT